MTGHRLRLRGQMQLPVPGLRVIGAVRAVASAEAPWRRVFEDDFATPAGAAERVGAIEPPEEPCVLRVWAVDGAGQPVPCAGLEGDWLLDGEVAPGAVFLPMDAWGDTWHGDRARFGEARSLLRDTTASSWLAAWEGSEDGAAVLGAAISVGVSPRFILRAFQSCISNSIPLAAVHPQTEEAMAHARRAIDADPAEAQAHIANAKRTVAAVLEDPRARDQPVERAVAIFVHSQHLAEPSRERWYAPSAGLLGNLALAKARAMSAYNRTRFDSYRVPRQDEGYFLATFAFSVRTAIPTIEALRAAARRHLDGP